MRTRSFRLSILILVILAISIAALAFREINIDIPGFNLARGGTGPLGLRLGLDLRGGAHLVYQADTSTRVEATFAQDVDRDVLTEAVAKLDLGELVFRFPDFRTASIKAPLLNEDQRQLLRDTLEQNFGVAETYEVSETPLPTSDEMEGVLSIINRRVNLFGTEEPIVQQFGEDRIIVDLPGASGSVTTVEFVEPISSLIVEEFLAAQGFEDFVVEEQNERNYKLRTVSLSQERREELQDALAMDAGSMESFQVRGGIEDAKALIGETALLEFKERTCDDRTCLSFTDADIGLTGDDLEDAFASTSSDTGAWQVNIQFDGRGSEIFSDLTQRIVNVDTKRISIFLDDEELLAPVALAWIRNGQSVITGNFTREEARTISIQLDSGRLPVPLKLIQESDVDALYGSESLRNSLKAGFVGLGLVMLFMLVYYRMAGLVACLALVFYAVVVLATFKLIPITLTLSHIGGFILSIGLAVDANILIFERMKEEIRIGRTLASSMEVGFSRAWPAIRDSNFSTIITCGVLLWFGNRLGGGLINGFALSLLIGVVASMFTAVVVSRNLLQVLAWIGMGRRISFFTPEKVPGQGQATGRAQVAQGGR